MNAGDVDTVNAKVVSGTGDLATIEAAQDALETAIADVPGVGSDSELHVAPEVQDRYDGLMPTPAHRDRPRRRLAGPHRARARRRQPQRALAQHDQETAAAAQQGAKERYQQALDRASMPPTRRIAQAKAVRDRLAKTADVSVLTSWIDRNAAYDKALRDLYEVLIEAEGKVTAKVRAAFDREQAARARLPGDTRPLVVIMADIAQGGLNQAVISIEDAAGRPRRTPWRSSASSSRTASSRCPSSPVGTGPRPADRPRVPGTLDATSAVAAPVCPPAARLPGGPFLADPHRHRSAVGGAGRRPRGAGRRRPRLLRPARRAEPPLRRRARDPPRLRRAPRQALQHLARAPAASCR